MQMLHALPGDFILFFVRQLLVKNLRLQHIIGIFYVVRLWRG